MIIRRLRIFLKHQSPFEREIIEEISIENDSDLDLIDLIFPLTNFKMGLKVYNADGYELPYLPKEQIKSLIEELDDDELFENMDRWIKGAVLWIKLPLNRAIKPNELRIIKLNYKDNRKLKSKFLSCFNIPNIIENKQIRKEDGFDTFYIIEIPEKYNIKLDMKNTRGIANLYENITDSLVSLRIPYKAGSYKLEFSYQITLPIIEEVFWKLLLLFLVFFTMAPILYHYQDISILPIAFSNYSTLTPVVISVCLLVLKITSEPIINRIKNLSLLFLFVNLICLILVN